jgi:phosphatidylglycerol:prolipoprotein diacylglycerol transferase
VVAFVPGVLALWLLKTDKFVSDDYAYSTSQFIGLVSALAVCFFYARFWEDARRSPKLAMALGLEGLPEEPKEPAPRKKKDDDEDEEEELPRKPKKKLAKKKPEPPPPPPKEEEEDDEGEPGDEPAPEKG